MYEWPSVVIAGALLLAMIAIMELGRIIGQRASSGSNDELKAHASTVQASLLGLLALLLGFTFSLSLNRFDDRSQALVLEANALGTAYLRTDLINPARGEETKRLLRAYGDFRVQAGSVSSTNYVVRAELRDKAERIATVLWRIAAEEAREFPGPAAVSFASALNETFDARAARDAAIDRHVPELVMWLLLGTFLLLAGVVGYSSMVSGVRPGLPIYSLMILIIVLVFIIIDLDRPRRGLIEIDQAKLQQTVNGMRHPDNAD